MREATDRQASENRAPPRLFQWGKSDQAACKPGLVPRIRSGTTVIHLRSCLRTTWCDLPGQHAEAHVQPRLRSVPIRSCSRWGLPSPLPCGRGGALLPHRFTLARPEGPAVCSLLRFPWGHPRRTLSGTLPPWSPDFPRQHRFRPSCRDRPAT